MARKRVKIDDMEVNYKFSCRCCLKSEAEFFKLDSLAESVIDNNNEVSTKIPLIRLLLFCMRTENLPELPQYICVECSKSLQIAYFFIQNGLRAHEILCRKLCPGKLKTSTRFNGQQRIEVCSKLAIAEWEALFHKALVHMYFVYRRNDMKQKLLRLRQSPPSPPCATNAKYVAQLSIIEWNSSNTFGCTQVNAIIGD